MSFKDEEWQQEPKWLAPPAKCENDLLSAQSDDNLLEHGIQVVVLFSHLIKSDQDRPRGSQHQQNQH